MTLIAKVWDFLFGVLLVGAAPVLALVAGVKLYVAIGLSLDLGPLSMAAVRLAILLVAPSTALFLMGSWRRRHRRLPVSLFGIEVLLGLFSGAAYFVYLVMMIGFAHIS